MSGGTVEKKGDRLSGIGSVLSRFGEMHKTCFEIVIHNFVTLKNGFMKSTFRILFYVKRDKQKIDGTLPIMCRITIDGEAARFFTKVNVNPDIWDSKAHIAIGRSREANEINTFLNDIRTSIHNVYHELLVHENTVSAEKVKNTFLGHGVEQRTLLEVMYILIK